MIRPTKIDFNNAHQNQTRLNYFGPSGLDVVCKTASEIKAEGGQDIGRINWGGTEFPEFWDPGKSHTCEEIYFARLIIDLKTSHSDAAPEYRSVVGAAKDFETAVEDLREKIEKRVLGAHHDTMLAPDNVAWAGNCVYSEPFLIKNGYRDIIAADLAYDFEYR